ncbi:phosphoribosylamine--glycine ligase [Haloimpatiens lingqiaonensis]|uniref:phosphoribosylamine--glycine ligase n=1 Tax=Haloimpatiens lingqiaonensis TaxID=1380675 RepID=UPI0010FF526D|nr:phosphoribosylamine--glycine ligase [Haloimpatiens lingqiaonensis]
MKLLVIGSGGREHAIAWKLSKSNKVDEIYCAPGNGGTALEEKCINVNLNSIDEYLSFAKENKIDVTVVGPEAPLVEGIVDTFKKEGLKIFGPDKKGALLEGSKAFAKEFMKKYGVKTAEYETFTDFEKAKEYIRNCAYPVVVKADGLAAGKGVVICEEEADAQKALEDFMVKDVFNGSGKKIVIEEFLNGVEASILSITDGETIIPFISSKDHKQIYDGNKGPNTGGMGVIAPNPYCSDEVIKEFKENILEPTLKGIKNEAMDYIGVIFFGIMITEKGVYLLEYNVRMGDPETQAVLYLMESDLMDIIMGALNKDLANINIKWENKHSCCVVVASEGYPSSYKKGYPIEIEDNLESKVIAAGAKLEEGKLVTNGGRVLCVVAKGDSLDSAREKAYRDVEKVKFQGNYYRKDIGELINN